ncbi:glutathione S-transferase Mu 1-like [Ixodes scapularis]|nr:glutathione S-transferase Mu 1-like [Ixodes scapularis]
MAPVLGYFGTRGKAQMIRNLLVYKNIDFEDRRLPFGGPPDYACTQWQAEKFSHGLTFPNLPYYIDGDFKLTQSLAILRYLGRKHDLAGRNEDEVTQLDFLEQQVLDLLSEMTKATLSSDVEVARKIHETLIGKELKPWDDFLRGRAWALGDRLTYVDFMLYEALDWIRDTKPDEFKRFPTLVKFLDKFEELPNIKQYMASDKYKKRPFLRRK